MRASITPKDKLYQEREAGGTFHICHIFVGKILLQLSTTPNCYKENLWHEHLYDLGSERRLLISVEPAVPTEVNHLVALVQTCMQHGTVPTLHVLLLSTTCSLSLLLSAAYATYSAGPAVFA